MLARRFKLPPAGPEGSLGRLQNQAGCEPWVVILVFIARSPWLSPQAASRVWSLSWECANSPELEFHPYVLAHLDPVLAIHKQHDIVVESYGPLSPVLRHKTGGPLKPVLQRIAERLTKEVGWDVDEATVLLQWTVQWGAVAVTTSSRKENIAKMVKSQSIKLTKEDMAEIEKAGRTVHYRFYDVSTSLNGTRKIKSADG